MSADAQGGAQLRVNREHIQRHIELLFGYISSGWLSIRSFGEEGTPSKHEPGAFRWVELDGDCSAAVAAAIEIAERNAGTDFATYIIPFPCRARGAGGHSDITEAAAIIADFDCAQPAAALQKAAQWLGAPAMVVASGGVTADGERKLHAYWSLDKPAEDIDAVANMQHVLALKTGGDVHFGRGRAHQPIRIAGSIHGKGGTQRACEILSVADTELTLEQATAAIEQMPEREGVAAPMTAEAARGDGGVYMIAQGADGLFDFSAKPPPCIEQHLTIPVHAGGEPDGRTRFTATTAVIGFYLRQVSDGTISRTDAWEQVVGWNLAMSKPPMDAEKLKREFSALERREADAAARRAEQRAKATSTAPVAFAAPAPSDETPGAPGAVVPFPTKPGADDGPPENVLLRWAAYQWVLGEPPPREFLVKGLVPAKQLQVLAADGGVGKSTLALSLAMQVAAAGNTNPAYSDKRLAWLGEQVVQGGTAVVLTAEDDADEVWRRLRSLDDDGATLIRRAGPRLIVLPLLDFCGGSFPLVRVAPDGTEMPTAQFHRLLGLLQQIEDLALVVIDTLASTLHGSENDGAVIQQWMRAANKINTLDAAVMIVHHTRKAGMEPVRNAVQMRESVRGSTAILNSVRAALGVWPATDFKTRMKSMGLEPRAGACYRMAVIKANNPEMSKFTKTLLREDDGSFRDVSMSDETRGRSDTETGAWLVAAIEHAAANGAPLTKSGQHGVFQRKSEMHSCLRHLPRRAVDELLDDVMAAKKVVRTATGALDVPDGRYAAGLDKDRASGGYSPPTWGSYYYDVDIDAVIEDFTAGVPSGSED